MTTHTPPPAAPPASPPGAPRAPPVDNSAAIAELDSMMAMFNDSLDLKADDVEHHLTEAQPSETALRCGLWDRAKGKEFSESEAGIKHALTPAAASDLHCACFSSNLVFEEKPIDIIRAKWLRTVAETPEFTALRNNTLFDEELSAIGTETLAGQYVAYVATLSPEEIERSEAGAETLADRAKRQKSARKACKDSVESVGEAADIMAGLGMGKGDKIDPALLKRTFANIRTNETLRKIMKLAGAYKLKAAGAQRRKPIHGTDDVVGVRLSDEINSLIPAELMKLKAPRCLKLDFKRRLVEKQAICRQHRATVPTGKGPIIVVCDESGSMSGEPNENSKAFALAMGWVACHQKRWIGFVGFSGGCDGTRIAFAPDKWDQDKLLDWLGHFYGGGTTLDVPLEQLPNVYWPELGVPKGKTDIVIITDACVHAPGPMVSRFNEWKRQEQAKCYGIIIGDQPGDLAHVCDKTWTINNFEIDCAPVDDLLAI